MMSKPMAASDYAPWDVVTVPFPFTDRNQTKKRPALVLSQSDFNRQAGHSVLAMITSAKNSAWPLDIEISDLAVTGLPVPSIIRMKLFTLDQRFIITKLGKLTPKDVYQVQAALNQLLGTEKA
jgi:mRNA interferase MazF